MIYMILIWMFSGTLEIACVLFDARIFCLPPKGPEKRSKSSPEWSYPRHAHCGYYS